MLQVLCFHYFKHLTWRFFLYSFHAQKKLAQEKKHSWIMGSNMCVFLKTEKLSEHLPKKSKYMHTLFQLKGELTLAVFLHIASFYLLYLYNYCLYPAVNSLRVVLAGCSSSPPASLVHLKKEFYLRGEERKLFLDNPFRWEKGHCSL